MSKRQKIKELEEKLELCRSENYELKGDLIRAHDAVLFFGRKLLEALAKIDEDEDEMS